MASVKQLQERKFKITVSNGYHTDGRKICRAKTIDVPASVPKRSVSQYVQHEAEQLEREFKLGYSEDADTSFEAFAQKWLARQTQYKPSTLAGYQAMLKICCQLIGGIRLRNIRPLTIEELAGQLRKREFRGCAIQNRTVKKYLEVVSTVLQDAKRNEIVPYNAVHRARIPTEPNRRQTIPTISEMSRLMEFIIQEPLVYRVYYTLALTTGYRRGELCALCWGDIQGNLLCVSKSRSRVQGVGIVETDTKNHRTRYVSLYNGMVLLLEELFYEKCRDQFDEFDNLISPGDPPEKTDYIFTEDKRPIQPDTFTHRLHRIYKRGGFSPEYHLHTMRHFYASYLLNSGVSNKVTADLLGHGDTGFLERTYGHTFPEYAEAAAACVGDMLGGKNGDVFSMDYYDEMIANFNPETDIAENAQEWQDDSVGSVESENVSANP